MLWNIENSKKQIDYVSNPFVVHTFQCPVVFLPRQQTKTTDRAVTRNTCSPIFVSQKWDGFAHFTYLSQLRANLISFLYWRILKTEGMLRKIDAFGRPRDDLRTKSALGGFITLTASTVAAVLFLAQLYMYICTLPVRRDILSPLPALKVSLFPIWWLKSIFLLILFEIVHPAFGSSFMWPSLIYSATNWI